ncbi:MAG TPA: YggT family protein [Solirubrobacteraceae bacterium]|jgi:YggT family protein|nr:YggT family protein [Solirubrobacteraceae bacterium]
MIALASSSARIDIGNYVSGLFTVYIVIIFIYILLNIMFSLGVRPPYSRVSDAILGFLRDVSEPYLRLFRRFIPPIGAIDLSPMVAIIVLYFVRSLLVSVIQG